jgi:hypothetical protein
MFAVEDAWLLLLIYPPPPGLALACLLFTSWVSSCLVALHLLGELLPASCPSPPEMDLELQESITMALLVSVGVGEEPWCSPGGLVNVCCYELSRAVLILPWSSAPGVGVLLCLHACQQPALQVELLVSS